jgi:hypothetical protein
MSNNNRKIVFVSILGAILATGILALNPSMIGNAGAQPYEDQYGYDKYPKKSSHTDIQKIKCVNSNINVNGVDITQIPQDGTATAAANEGGQEGTNAANTENGNGLAGINFDRNLVNICVNVNVNEQVKVSPPPEGEEPSPCEDCFSVLSSPQIRSLLANVQATSIGEYCERLLLIENSCTETDNVIEDLQGVPGISAGQIIEISNCLVSTGVITQQCD